MRNAALSLVQPISISDLGVYACKGVLMFVFVAGLFRLLGKRHVGSFNTYDIAMLMAASNAVQNAITGGRGNFAVGVVVSTSIVLSAWLISRVVVARPTLRPLLGAPSVLVIHGKVLDARLRRHRVPRADLDAAMREHGIDDVSTIALAVLERNGAISVIPETTS